MNVHCAAEEVWGVGRGAQQELPGYEAVTTLLENVSASLVVASKKSRRCQSRNACHWWKHDPQHVLIYAMKAKSFKMYYYSLFIKNY